MLISDLLSPERICCDVKSSSKKRLLELISEELARNSEELSKREIFESLCARERLGSTGLGNGVAVPHAKAEGIAEAALVLGRSRQGIEWQAIDGRPVHIVFLLVSKAGEAEQHLACLRWISTLARSADFRRFLLDAAGEAEMRELLVEMTPKK